MDTIKWSCKTCVYGQGNDRHENCTDCGMPVLHFEPLPVTFTIEEIMDRLDFHKETIDDTEVWVYADGDNGETIVNDISPYQLFNTAIEMIKRTAEHRGKLIELRRVQQALGIK
jgi:hypothetical protein